MSRRFTVVPARPQRASVDASQTFAALNRQRFFDIDHLHISVRLGNYHAESLYWGVLEGKWWRNYLHAHSFFEMCYAFTGKGKYRVRDEELPVKSGELFLATPGLPHEIISSRQQPLGIFFWAFTLLHEPLPQANGAEASVDGVIESLPSVRQFVHRPGPQMERTLDLIVDEIARRQPGYIQALHALAEKLLLESLRACAPPQKPAEPLVVNERGARSVVQTAIRYLRDNYARPIGVRDVAAQVHLSERHLSRLFQRETGTSILDFLTGVRVETASQLLLDDKLSIKQVARAVGYPDPHYFTTLFGRRIGMTPGTFRRKGGTSYADESKRRK